MTRSYFVECVDEWWELLGVMSDSEYDITCDVWIYDDNQYDSDVNDDIDNSSGDTFWTDLRDYLVGLPETRTGHFYRRNYSFDYDDVTGDFDYYKQDVLEYLDDREWFDDEEEEPDTYPLNSVGGTPGADRSDIYYIAYQSQPKVEEEQIEIGDFSAVMTCV